MSTSYILFNTLTVPLTYWVILRAGLRVFCLDDTVALYYQFYIKKMEEKNYSVKLIKDKTAS